MTVAAYRIETERLVLRCWDPRDAAAVKEAIDSSLDHLRPWMPWARDEPQSLDDKVALLRTFRSRFDAGEDFTYGVLAADDRTVLGGAGLHARHADGALEIGYWIRADAVRRGYATELTAALTRVAFDVFAVDRVEIRVDPENEVSARIPQRLGSAEEARLRRRLPPRKPGGPRRDTLVFSLFADGFPDSAASAAARAIAAYDALGRRLL